MAEISMQEQRFAFGERVRHRLRPEWGVGSVTKVVEVVEHGVPGQRVSVRFPNAGVKTLLTSHAPLERVDAAPVSEEAGDEAERFARDGKLAHWTGLSESDWLAPLAQRKIDEVMTAIPEVARDPFRSVEQRFRAMLDLYRFDRSGGALIDWAVAQTGLADPLSRFNRHELERYFDRWAAERDAQLGRVFQEARTSRQDLTGLLRGAPASAGRALRRFDARR